MHADARRTRIKFCGITSPAEAQQAIEAGADAIGVIAAPSPRRVDLRDAVSIALATPAFVDLFAVFVDPDAQTAQPFMEIGARAQFHGSELPELCERLARGPYLKAFHFDAGTAADSEKLDYVAGRYTRGTLLVDSRVGNKLGGTGVPVAWEPLRAVASRRRIVVSGGLTPENVGECVRTVRPFAVDVRSGIETGGAKDVEKMRAFVHAVREADAQA